MSKAISKPSLSEQCKVRLKLADSEDFQTEYRRIRSDLKLVCGDIVNLHYCGPSKIVNYTNEQCKKQLRESQSTLSKLADH